MDKVDKSLAVALGAGVTTNPMQMAQAYGTLLTAGSRMMPTSLPRLKMQVAKWSRVTARNQPRCLVVPTTDKMTNMMLGTFSNGTGVNAAPYGYTMAGKPVRQRPALTRTSLETNG